MLKSGSKIKKNKIYRLIKRKSSITKMLQHPTTDFYDLSTPTAVSGRKTPPYSPTGGGLHTSNNNNNNSINNNNGLDILGHNGSSGVRESLPSFGFTQEQVACVCEVS